MGFTFFRTNVKIFRFCHFSHSLCKTCYVRRCKQSYPDYSQSKVLILKKNEHGHNYSVDFPMFQLHKMRDSIPEAPAEDVLFCPGWPAVVVVGVSDLQNAGRGVMQWWKEVLEISDPITLESPKIIWHSIETNKLYNYSIRNPYFFSCLFSPNVDFFKFVCFYV